MNKQLDLKKPDSICWSEWYPLSGEIETYSHIPIKRAGLYRIRSNKLNELIYIGQTGRCLRERLRALRKGVYSEFMPFNDPHTAAPNLWVWRYEANLEYEFSFLPTTLETPQRQGLEDYFLWRHRHEHGCSTLCNYGRFHRSWIKPTNKKQGRAGLKLEEGEFNSAGVLSSPPLQPHSSSFKNNWMGLSWSKKEPLELAKIKLAPIHPAIYRIHDANSQAVIYIGETHSLASRLKAHARKSWGGVPVLFSFFDELNLTEPHLRHEYEVDLIGAFFEEQGRVPKFQYGGS
ncbi:hypothetical protein [Vibrio crassostreae]|jgi:predicted GIY-YIG superfamily endonuclease|uniref:hypothetical protein n=1 Tax=Vibrio crassostreae TaxID=246167 RepID=UPI001B312875|nr:hypothetical protein [Vibrio crassostreae]